jgi:Leucine-rich repeat (LRR) protein
MIVVSLGSTGMLLFLFMVGLLLLSDIIMDISSAATVGGCSGNISVAAYNALQDLYVSTAGENWLWSPKLPSSTVWHFPSDRSAPCSDNWQGIICTKTLNSAICELNVVELESYNLVGSLPSSLQDFGPEFFVLNLQDNLLDQSIPIELANLVSLEELNLAKNSLLGGLPSELGRLTNLRVLSLNTNMLGSTIPTQYGNLVNLAELDLSLTFLTGAIPSQLGLLESMYELDLSRNALDSSIVSELSKGRSLLRLYLDYNALTGTIPTELGDLSNLSDLDLYNNSLSSSIPSELGNLHNLSQLVLDNNWLVGEIPATLGNLSNLIGVWLNTNMLTGQIPSELGNLTKLEQLYFEQNLLGSTLPAELGNMSRLRDLYVEFNYIEGSIPTELGNLLKLTDLDLLGNYFQYSIFSELGNMSDLVILYLSMNQLTQPIPFELGNLAKLQQLDLNGNSLSGLIPSSLGNLADLQSIIISSNSLDGTIPPELVHIPRLLVLVLDNNSLEGAIPSSFGDFRFLETMKLDSNSLTGRIPAEFENLVALQALALDSNLLTGPLFKLDNLTKLQLLDVQGNLLSATIPFCWNCLPALESMVLSGNYFEGRISSSITALQSLEQLDFSFNLMTGALPAGLDLMGNVRSLTLNNNQFSGFAVTPPPKIESLDMSNNVLSGPLSFLENVTRIMYVNLGSNLFSGKLPAVIISSWYIVQAINFSSNKLTGPLDISTEKKNSSDSLNYLQSVDLSNNRLTGTVDGSLFLLPSLQTVFLSRNCFSGSISDSICGNSALQYIVLDLLTANCGGGTTGLSGFVLTHYLDGVIPSCIWNSTSIRVLHLLGNGLVGSVGPLANGSKLSVVALGSNQITGTMPPSFQSHQFEQLDLSINRLSGTLQSDLRLNPMTTTTYALSVNRLSGLIPNSMFAVFNASVLNVLEGNLFGCQQSNIPSSDADHASYQCGSVDFEDSLATWVGVFGTAVVTVLLLTRGNVSNMFQRIFATPMAKRACAHFLIGPAVILSLGICCLVGYVTVKLVGGHVSDGYSTHSVQYWWTSTATFMHGWGVGVVWMLLLAGSCAVFVTSVLSLVNYRGTYKPKPKQESSEKEDASSLVVATAKNATMHVVNIAVITVVNGIYVLLAVENLSGGVLVAAQAALGLLKLTWSLKAIPSLIAHLQTESSARFPHRIFMILFVFVGAPFISTFFESSSCFLYVVTSPNQVSFSFSIPSMSCYENCAEECVISCTTVCEFSCDSFTMQTIYGTVLPPWMYSYQCSSALITNYAPVMILSYAISGIAIPVTVISLAYSFKHVHRVVAVTAKKLISRLMLCADSETIGRLLQDGYIEIFGRGLASKYILDLSVLLTFGLAVPVLAVMVFIGIIFNLASDLILLRKFVKCCAENGMAVDTVENIIWESILLHRQEVVGSCYVVMGFVGIFWSIFMFDWIADTNGTLSGGLAMLVPLLMPLAIGWTLLRAKKLGCSPIFQRIRNRTDISVEKRDLSTVLLPQQTDDDFERGSYIVMTSREISKSPLL